MVEESKNGGYTVAEERNELLTLDLTQRQPKTLGYIPVNRQKEQEWWLYSRLTRADQKLGARNDVANFTEGAEPLGLTDHICKAVCIYTCIIKFKIPCPLG